MIRFGHLFTIPEEIAAGFGTPCISHIGRNNFIKTDYAYPFKEIQVGGVTRKIHLFTRLRSFH